MNSMERRDQVTDTPAASQTEWTAVPETVPTRLRFHHVAVQTDDLASSISWYKDFFGAKVTWTLEEFSELSLERLPGLSSLAELTADELRFHLFTRGAHHRGAPPSGTNQFQHVCVEVPTPKDLLAWYSRWHAVYDSGVYTFTRDAPATDIVVDNDGVQSFYAYDPNGIEFEFTFLPVTGPGWSPA